MTSHYFQLETKKLIFIYSLPQVFPHSCLPWFMYHKCHRRFFLLSYRFACSIDLEVPLVCRIKGCVSWQGNGYSYEREVAVEHLVLPCCSIFILFVCCMKFSSIFLLVHEFGLGVRIFKKNCWCANSYTSVRKKTLVYEFGPGVRIFKKIAGVRIRTLVHEKKNSDTNQKLCLLNWQYPVIFL